MATLQVLMAEHASLVSARSLAYNEAFTRAGMFLQALGMSFLGLSLLGAALGFSQDVLVIAMVVVAFDVLIGIATFRRVADTGREDLRAMQAMNRIRQGLRARRARVDAVPHRRRVRRRAERDAELLVH